MEKLNLLLGIFNKQIPVIWKLYDDVRYINLDEADKRYVFTDLNNFKKFIDETSK